MKHKVQGRENELEQRPGLSLQLDAALGLGKQLRHEIIESLRTLEDGHEVATIIHLEEALDRLKDMSHAIVVVMNCIDLLYIYGQGPVDTDKKTGKQPDKTN